MGSIRTFIADDHELVRFALRTMLEAEPDIEVVGEASECAAAIEECTACEPDVLLLDVRMPGAGGVEVCRAVRERIPRTAVLVLTSFEEDEDLFGMLSAGASGYLLKDTKPERIVHAIRSVASGQAVFDAAVVGRVISGRADKPASLAEPLSSRETEVLRLMAMGLSNKEIGRALWIGETTVKTHVSHVLRKLGQTDRVQAVLEAVRLGLVTLKD